MDAQAPEERESLELFGLFGNCNSPTYRLGMHARIFMDVNAWREIGTTYNENVVHNEWEIFWNTSITPSVPAW
jgi:hypothetical protein